MKLHLATPHNGSVAHVCTLNGHKAVPVCRTRGFYARDEFAKKKCPSCLAAMRKVLRQKR